jgi:aminomethyltransferase
MDVLIGDTVVGRVTSGCLSPSLGYPIAMAYVAADSADQGHYRVQLGKQAADAEAVPMPFYKP